MLQLFRNVGIMSMGYIFAVGGVIIMYTLLPIIYTEIWGSQGAGIALMILTVLQVFLFGPLAAHFVDTYGARMLLFFYTIFFVVGALCWYASYYVDHPSRKMLLVVVMTVLFAAGFGCRFVDVYTLRTSTLTTSGISFGILVTFA